jgi:hypothetical protein
MGVAKAVSVRHPLYNNWAERRWDFREQCRSVCFEPPVLDWEGHMDGTLTFSHLSQRLVGGRIDLATAKAILRQAGYKVREEKRLGNNSGTQLKLG